MNDTIRGRIQRVTREMADAEGELERALKEMRIGARAEKTTVTAVVEAALDRVRTARSAIAQLTPMLEKDD